MRKDSLFKSFESGDQFKNWSKSSFNQQENKFGYSRELIEESDSDNSSCEE